MTQFNFLSLALAIPLAISLSGCFPTVLTGATVSATKFAKDRPAAETLKDIKIATAIKANFIKSNFRELYTKIQVEVINGRVLYTGRIDKEEDAVNALQIAWSQEGVTEVINELKVDKNNNNFDLVQYTRDSLITSQIKSKTFLDREIKFANYTVVTANDIVYLFGIARSEEELRKVANIAANVHGVIKVVSHVRIDELEADEHRVSRSETKYNAKSYSRNAKADFIEKNDSLIIDDEISDEDKASGQNNW